MRKMVRKFMALTMVGVLMATPLTAFAATGTTEETTEPATGNATGAGELEGFLTEDDEIFSVTLPTDDNSAPTFKFTMDPQNLLKQTDGSNYTTTDTVLFSTKTGTSNELSITNNSQFDVDVSLNATMSGLSGTDYAIAMAADKTFKDADNNVLTDTSLYLGLVYETAAANSVDAVASTEKAITADGITEKVTLGGMPTNYEIGKDAGDNYIYKKIASPATATGVAKFKMTGACNPNADWSAIDDLATPAAPTVKVVWSVEKHKENEDCTFTASETVGVINYTKGAGTGELDRIESITMSLNGRTYDGLTDSGQGWSDATVTGTTITLDSAFTSCFTDGTATITYYVKNDSEAKTATVVVRLN